MNRNLVDRTPAGFHHHVGSAIGHVSRGRGYRDTLAMTRRVYVWQLSVALDETTAARRAQPRTQRLGRFASIRRDADAMPDRRVAHGRAHEERLTAAKDRLIFLLQRVSGKPVAARTHSGNIPPRGDAPLTALGGALEEQGLASNRRHGGRLERLSDEEGGLRPLAGEEAL